jgi:hypothetical protein
MKEGKEKVSEGGGMVLNHTLHQGLTYRSMESAAVSLSASLHVCHLRKMLPLVRSGETGMEK